MILVTLAGVGVNKKPHHKQAGGKKEKVHYLAFSHQQERIEFNTVNVRDGFSDPSLGLGLMMK